MQSELNQSPPYRNIYSFTGECAKAWILIPANFLSNPSKNSPEKFAGIRSNGDLRLEGGVLYKGLGRIGAFIRGRRSQTTALIRGNAVFHFNSFRISLYV